MFVDGLNVSLQARAIERYGRFVDERVAHGLASAGHLVRWVSGAHGQYQPGDDARVDALASGFLSPISTLISTGLQLQLLRSYLERIDDVLKTAPEQDKGKASQAERLSGEIRLERVSFSYGPLAPAGVREISVKIVPGQKVAIVGKSGAGKSTLAKLMLGLYQPASGRILYDGHDLARLDLQSVRHQFGIVTQRSYLFGATIRENIALKDPTIPMPEVIEAAKLAMFTMTSWRSPWDMKRC